MFNLAIDSKLRGCDVMAVKVEDVGPHGTALDRETVRQRKTGHPVRFELTEQTREFLDAYIKATQKRPGDFLFPSRRLPVGASPQSNTLGSYHSSNAPFMVEQGSGEPRSLRHSR